MEKTKKALEKLNDKQFYYCEQLSEFIESAIKSGLKELFEKKCGKLRGYLECLWHMGILEQSEMRALYLYFLRGK